jgi:hypothetical protein
MAGGGWARTSDVKHRVIQRFSPRMLPLVDELSCVTGFTSRLTFIKLVILFARNALGGLLRIFAEEVVLYRLDHVRGDLLGRLLLVHSLSGAFWEILHIAGAEVVDVIVHALAELVCEVDG